MFGRVALINLDARKDRLGAFKAKVLDIPVLANYVRYRAIHGDTVSVPGFFVSGGGAWGCRQSHLRVLEDAMLDGVSDLLVLEDDVRFTPNFQEKLTRFMRTVPDDWDALMLGGQDQMPPSDIGVLGVARSRDTQRTHAYVIRGLEAMRELYRLWARCDRHIDHWFGQFQQRFVVYEPTPFLCGQDETASDISGRHDTVRYWNNSVLDNKTIPIHVLMVERAVAERLRMLGFHFGYSREPITGHDKGIIEIEKSGWPSEQFSEWGNVITYEAGERGDVPGIWHSPLPDAAFLEQRLGRPVIIVEARSVEDAIVNIPSLIPRYLASKIVWCWRGQGYEVLEGLAYHGWHRGHWRDEVTGLDQGIRQAVEHRKPHLFKQMIRQLSKESEKVRYGKVLLAHPELHVQAVRDELPEYDVQELVGEDIKTLVESYESIMAAVTGMYKG